MSIKSPDAVAIRRRRRQARVAVGRAIRPQRRHPREGRAIGRPLDAIARFGGRIVYPG